MFLQPRRKFTKWLASIIGPFIDSHYVVRNNLLDEPGLEQAFDAFERHGITPHITPWRHRNFWDGGIHCITLDLHREGDRIDYFKDK